MMTIKSKSVQKYQGNPNMILSIYGLGVVMYSVVKVSQLLQTSAFLAESFLMIKGV